MGGIAADHLEESSKGGAYEEQAKKKAISRATNARRPKARYLIGFGAKPLIFLHTILPTRWFDYMMMHAS